MGDYRSAWRRGALAGIAGTALTAALAAGAPAHAQEADAQAAAAVQGSTLTDGAPATGDIIVTATRRVSTTLRVPMSIVALNTEGLVKSNVKSMEDIARVVPGITYTANGPQVPASTSVSIRGVVASGGDSVTGFYLDDVEVTGVLPAVFDVARVEVLRGPQGTLFGAGAMGGALRFIQNRPGLTEFSGRAVAEIAAVQGGGITTEAGLAVGGPIVPDRLGFRVSAWRRNQGGYIDRFEPMTGEVEEKNSNRIRTMVASAALTWAPVDELRITPSIYWQKMTVPHGGGYHEDISDPDDTFFQNGSSVSTPIRDRFYVPSLTVEADVGFADLVSVTSLMRRNQLSFGDLTLSFGARLPVVFLDPDGYGNPLNPAFALLESDIALQKNEATMRNFSQELRLSSSDPDATLSWTIGAYYSKNDSWSRVSWPDGEPGTPPLFGGFDSDNVSESTREQLSGFAQVDLRVIEGLKLTAGVRVAKVEVELARTNLAVPNPVTIVGKTSSTPINPKFGIEYQIDPQNMIYVSAGKGFRAGGVNPPLENVPGCTEQVSLGYGPDSLWSYEVGTKNRLFNDVLTLSASAFHIKWADRQTSINFTACGGGYTVNVGTAEMNGFDAIVSLAPLPGLRADFSVAYNDSKFTQDVFDVTPAARPVVLDGYALASSISPWTMTGSLEYSFPVAGHDAFVRVEDSYKNRNPGPFMFQVPTAAAYNPDLSAYPGYHQVNLRAGVEIDNLNVALFMTNAFNAHPALGRTNLAPNVEFWFASTIAPRTVGVNMNLEF